MAHQFIDEIEPLAGETITGSTRDNVLRYAKAIFNGAVEWEELSRSPFRSLKESSDDEKPWHYTNAEQFKRLLDTAPSLRWQAVYALAYTCGLRASEIFSLRWQDICFEVRIVRICIQSATETQPPFRTKNGKSRDVPLTEYSRDIFLRWQLQQGRHRQPYAILTPKQYENVLVRWQTYKSQKRTWENKALVNNVQREFNRHVVKAGIEHTDPLTLHTLRKSCIKNWADRVLNPRVTQELAGHKDLKTTMKYYSRVNPHDMKKAASGIDALLGQSDAKLTPDTASA